MSGQTSVICAWCLKETPVTQALVVPLRKTSILTRPWPVIETSVFLPWLRRSCARLSEVRCSVLLLMSIQPSRTLCGSPFLYPGTAQSTPSNTQTHTQAPHARSSRLCKNNSQTRFSLRWIIQEVLSICIPDWKKSQRKAAWQMNKLKNLKHYSMIWIE